MQNGQIFKLAIICGGPSNERGISLNSARSIMDHLQSSLIEIIPLYVDYQKQFYRISAAQLYSNTPADFDFKLNQTAFKLDFDDVGQLLQSIDLVFPAIHGLFGKMENFKLYLSILMSLLLDTAVCVVSGCFTNINLWKLFAIMDSPHFLKLF